MTSTNTEEETLILKTDAPGREAILDAFEQSGMSWPGFCQTGRDQVYDLCDLDPEASP